MSESYSVLAKYYDELMGDFNYESYVSYISKFAKGKGLDLCCGSGKITRMLSELGNDMTGMDISIDMLNEAVSKGGNITYVQGDISKLKASGYDFITCVCDGLNYIHPNKLEKTVLGIKNALTKGGYFIFDISSEYKLKYILGNESFFEEYEDFAYIWQNRFSRGKLNMDLTFFSKIEGETFKRESEYHIQYAHSLENIMNALSGLKVKVVDGETFKSIKSYSKRLLFVCRK